MNKFYLPVIVLIVGLFLPACNPKEPSPQETETVQLPAVMSAYPLPEITAAPNTAYPAPDNSSEYVYPAPGQEVVTQPVSGAVVIPFRITKPIEVGATRVIGTGTPGVPLVLVNVTMIGEVIAETVIQEDGTFIFDVQPLESGTRIGLILGDLDRTSWVLEDFYNPGYNGDDARNVPMVGFLWDTALITNK